MAGIVDQRHRRNHRRDANENKETISSLAMSCWYGWLDGWLDRWMDEWLKVCGTFFPLKVNINMCPDYVRNEPVCPVPTKRM